MGEKIILALCEHLDLSWDWVHIPGGCERQLNSDEKGTPGVYTIEKLDGKPFAVVTGTLFDEYVRTYFPNSKIQYYNNITDMLAAVENKKADACLLDEPVARIIVQSYDTLEILEEVIIKDDYAYAAAKTEFGLTLSRQISEFIQELNAKGTLDQLKEIWLGSNEKIKKIKEWENLPALHGTIRFVTVAQAEPFLKISRLPFVGGGISA